jgi:hypothetical protein
MKMRVRRPEDTEKVEIEMSGHCNHRKVHEKKLDSPVKEKLREYEEQEGPKKSPKVMRRQLRVCWIYRLNYASHRTFRKTFVVLEQICRRLNQSKILCNI